MSQFQCTVPGMSRNQEAYCATARIACPSTAHIENPSTTAAHTRELPRLSIRFIPSGTLWDPASGNFAAADCALQYRRADGTTDRFYCSGRQQVTRQSITGVDPYTYWSDKDRAQGKAHSDDVVFLNTTEEELIKVAGALNACCVAKVRARKRCVQDMFASWGDPKQEPSFFTAVEFHSSQLVVLVLRECLSPHHPAVQCLTHVHARGSTVEEVQVALMQASARFRGFPVVQGVEGEDWL